MPEERIKELLQSLQSRCSEELAFCEKTGFIRNYMRLANYLNARANMVVMIGRWYQFSKGDPITMKLRLNRAFRQKLLQAAALLLADAADGTIEAAEQTASLLEELAKELRAQNAPKQ